jgi:glycosyltransferase involved in cell wall biosynthesis
MPDELKPRCEWIPVYGEHSGDWFANLRVLPAGMRYRRHKTWHVRQGLQREREWDALFLANFQVGQIGDYRRHKCYYYTDLTLSLMKQMPAWYQPIITRSGPLNAYKEKITQEAFERFAGFFCMSKWAAGGVQVDHHIPPEKCHISHPGANLNRWKFTDRSERSGNVPVRLLMTGGEFMRKGGDYLLRWAEITRSRNWELDIITWAGELPSWVSEAMGNPEAGSQLSAALAPKLPNVRVHIGMKANTPEIMELFAAADVFCLPTHADGSSIASLEAMATGLPVVVGAVGGIPELITDGVTGFLQKQDDYEDFAAKLDRLVEDRDLRLEIGRAARQSCEDYFNVTRQVRDIFRVVDEDNGRSAGER